MGVIFRNGIPYGATESDVTTVAEFADLYDLTDKQENHLYIVEETNKPYRYDEESDEFYLLASDIPVINASKYQMLISDGNNWATHNNWYSQWNPSASESALYAKDATAIVLGGGAYPDVADRPNNYDGWLIPNGPFFKVANNSRLTVSEGAWADITGAGTEFKVNSGSKIYLDSYYGPNNFYMHGGFITINDAKEASYSKPDIYYGVPKSSYPNEPDADLDWFERNGEIVEKNANFSTNYPYTTEETAIINSLTSISELENIGYTYTVGEVESGQGTINGTLQDIWKLKISLKKTEPDFYELNTSGIKPYCYDNDEDWPADSEDVPRINITGAPHMTIGDYSCINIQSGGIVEILNNGKLRLDKDTHVSLSSSHFIMQSGESGGVAPSSTTTHPYLVLTDDDITNYNNISLGFTLTKPINPNSSGSVIMSDILSTPERTHCYFQPTAVEGFGPYSNFHVMRLNFSNSNAYLDGWLNSYVGGNSSNPARYNMLPLFHIGGPVYYHISVDSTSRYIHHPQIASDSVYEFTPEVQGESRLTINPCMTGSSELMIKAGGKGGAKTHIQFMPDASSTDILVDTASGCQTFLHDNRAGGTSLAVHIGSISNSNMLFSLNGGMGETGYYNQSIIDQNGIAGTIQKIIEGIDTFEIESGQIHKEMKDDARFIMRGENYSSLNGPNVSYLNDISQGAWANGGFGRFNKNTCHLNKYWDRPINNEDFNKSPTFQMYECSNLILRGYWKYPERTVTIPTNAYASLAAPISITLEELKSHTTEWEYFLGTFANDEEFIGLVPESQIVATSTDITVMKACFQFIGDNSYVKKYHPNAGLDTFGKRSSLLEITDNSELRLWDGICIYGRYDPQTNKPGIEIINRYNTNGTDMDENGAKSPREKITFTFDEFRLLKRLIENFSPSIDELVSTNQESGLVNNIGLTGIMEEVE